MKKDDLISRSALMKYINEHHCYSSLPMAAHICTMELLTYAPTVDAMEVVHGRWELHGNDDNCDCSYFCSNCHKSYDEDWFYVNGQYKHWSYCPNCGARMDG